MRTIARRKENSSLDFLHEATLGMSFTFASLMYASGVLCKLIEVRMSWASFPWLKFGQSRFGDFK